MNKLANVIGINKHVWKGPGV